MTAIENLRAACNVLAGNQSTVVSVKSIATQIAELKERLLELYKLQAVSATHKPVEVTDDFLKALYERFAFNDCSVDVCDNTLQIFFDTRVAFHNKDREYAFYVTSMPYGFQLRVDLVSLKTTMYVTDPDPVDPRLTNHGIYVCTADDGDWGHPHALKMEVDGRLDTICYGANNYFPGLLHQNMTLNEISHFLDRALTWFRWITADDNYNKSLRYATGCMDLHEVEVDGISDKKKLREALLEMEDAGLDANNINTYAAYYQVYAYHVLCGTSVPVKDLLLHTIGADIAFGLVTDPEINLYDDHWYVDTLRHCREELEDLFV